VHDAVNARIPADQPDARKLAREAATQRYTDAEKAAKQQQDESTARAYKWVLENGGRVTNMPAALLVSVPPQEMDNLLAYGNRLQKGEDVTDPRVFQWLATDDKAVRTMSDAEFFKWTRQLSRQDAKQMVQRRGELLNPDSTSGKNPGNLDTAGVNAILNNRLQQIGIDPAPKDGTEEAKRVGVIRQHVWSQLLQAQRAAGKRFDDAEIAKAVDAMFSQNVTFQTSILGINTGTSSQRLLSMKAGDIPSEVRRRLREDFRKQGISEPSDADLLGAYFLLRSAIR
jgi:hypothetical protein